MTRASVISSIATTIVSISVLFAAAAAASNRYDPALRFRTISTPRFDIHYHQGEERDAQRLAEIAESVAARLDATLGRPPGRVHVILVNQTDLSNGWATPIPYNTIELVAAAPEGDSFLGNTSDWLRLVFSHEYTHIVHLSRGQGWIGGLRRGFGRLPLLYPNLYSPIWQIEGIAVYEESALTGEGRIYDRSFRSIIDVAAGSSRLEPIDRANGGLVDWPSGNVAYAYGANFHQFLAAKYGDAAIRQLTDATAGRIPYLGAPAFKKVFKRSLGDLWKDFEANAAAAASVPADASVTRVTHHGFTVGGPRFGPSGRVYYSVANPHGFPALLSVSLEDHQPAKIVDRFLGNAIGVKGSVLVFDQAEMAAQVALQFDLYAVSLEDRHSWRLTTGARAADPDVAPDGRRIVCTIQRTDRRELALLTLPDGRQQPGAIHVIVSEPGVSFAAPRWSPDGKWIAAERGTTQIVLIDPATRTVVRTVAAAAAGRSVSPSWTADGSLLFASDRDGGAFRIYRTSIETGATSRLEGTGDYAREPEASADGTMLVYVGYTPDGYDIFSMPLAHARWTPVESTVAAASMPLGSGSHVLTPGVPPSPGTGSMADRGYSPWRTLAPTFWTPTIESDNGELVVGAATGSFDALGRHAYAVEGGWASSRLRPDWQVAYAYDRWRPTIFANVSDDTDPFRDGELRTVEANAGVLIPFRRVRWSQSILGAFHASTDSYTCSGCSDSAVGDVTRNAVRAGWRLSTARAYGYSISLEHGWTATVTTELTREALGADGNSGASTADIRGYLPIVPRHGVLAGRIAAASTWGDRVTRRAFSASGNGPQLGGFNFESDAVGLLRGLSEDDLVGRHAAIANLDYRVPLMRIDRGLGTWPVFVRALHGALFSDVGNAWTSTFKRSDVRVSVGGELSLDTVLGYFLPVTFTGGVAWVSHDRGAVVFGRVGRAF
jgi:Tol biopolymer transport system component